MIITDKAKLDLHVLVAHDVDFVTEISVGKESLIAAFVAHTATETFMYSTPFGDEESKKAILGFLRAEFKRRNIIAYSHFSECWYLDETCMAMRVIHKVVNKEVPPHLRKRAYRYLMEAMPPPSEHPDRKEAMTIGAFSATHGVQRMLPILRDKAGLISGFAAPTTSMEGKIGEEIEGRMAELLVSEELDG